ncbi:DUF5131 family protein [Alicyclobacillus sp. SO9]|uniref:DUF5131 family protein n=1 Tax=Alicyclobacillus sp. SO9 TaxID=2665646 RepID=UPI0018E78B1B|nr:phage Gp37/Gp68 family protein [Alicyclobacillus sp. SO9]QQE79511.1 phage Gp37/Gp68 family protein [Alicyclobacillus sp. SO9]
MTTKIEWTEETWNPVTGCSKVSAGCTHCYAETLDRRFAKKDGHPFRPWNSANMAHNVRLHPERIDAPLHWRKPRRVFVNSMSDLFHEKVPFEFLDEVFAVMLACAVLESRTHTFQVLTKRPARMMEYLTHRSPSEMIKAWAYAGDGLIHLTDGDVLFSDAVYTETVHDWDAFGHNSNNSPAKSFGYTKKLWPLPNVWLGVSVENQQAADERIPMLLQTPAAVRFLSCEPLLGPIDLNCITLGGEITGNGKRKIVWDALNGWEHQFSTERTSEIPNLSSSKSHPDVDWVIAGGESGPGARLMHPEWVRSLRDQCMQADVPFFFKQWGEWAPFLALDKHPGQNKKGVILGKETVWRVGKRKAGRMLDGCTWDEFPKAGGK